MAEKKAKIPLTEQVKLPDGIGRAIAMEAVRLNKFKYEIIEAAWQAYQARRDQEKASSGTPASVEVVSAPLPKENLPGEVESAISVIRRLWHVSAFRECVEALVQIWAAGDSEIQESITLNCRSFARMSAMAIGGGRDARGLGTTKIQQRIEALLADAEQDRPRGIANQKVFDEAAEGPGRDKQMGGGAVRKKGGGGDRKS